MVAKLFVVLNFKHEVFAAVCCSMRRTFFIGAG